MDLQRDPCVREQVVELRVERSGDQRLQALVTGPLDPELDDLLSDAGIALQIHDDGKPFLGVALKSGSTRVASVTRGSPACRDGLAPDDELLAIAGLRVTSSNWQTVFAAVAAVDQPVDVLVSRRGAIRTLEVTPAASPGTAKLMLDPSPTAEQLAAREAWLGAEPS